MAGTTGIEWCDATFNPWWGCEKVSPACAHCYADTLSKRYAAGKQLWGDGHEFRFFGDKHWAEPLKWARLLPAKLGRRPRIFTASMADVFEERAELDEHRERLFELIEATPELDWLILTKRPYSAADFFRAFYWGDFKVLPNIWLGVSIENARFTWRADVLRGIPAAVRFVSAEPLLGSLVHSRTKPSDGVRLPERKPIDLTGIDWVIAGGESGPKARPSHPDWFRELREACLEQHGMDARAKTRGPAFLFKQWGEWLPYEQDPQPPFWCEAGERTIFDAHGFPDGLSDNDPVRNATGTWWCPDIDSDIVYRRTGKKANGRHLDGRTWDEFPASVAVPA